MQGQQMPPCGRIFHFMGNVVLRILQSWKGRGKDVNVWRKIKEIH